MADPILKWAGGKRQLLDEIYARFPDEFRIKIEETQKKDEQEKITEKHPNGKVNFHEPFVGGGAVIFDLEPKWGTLNDTNSRLINFYTQVKTNPQKIIEISETFRSPKDSPDKSRRFHTKNRKGKPIKNFYYQQREIFNNRPYGDEFDPVEEAAILLYLNRTCYNGLYRENSKGGFNTPIGSYKNPDWRRKEQILALHEVLNQIKIYNRDFDYVLEIASPGDLIYFDPPYQPMSPTSSFKEYSADGFDMDDQKRLLQVATKLNEKGVHIIMSNSGIMYDLYEEHGFRVDMVGARRAINSDASKRGEVNEILATNISEHQIN